jgi:hypothetical protein
VFQNLEPVIEPEVVVELTPMEIDNTLCHNTHKDPINTIKDPKVGKPMSNKEAYGDKPDKPGISDKDREGEVHNNEKEKVWKLPTLEATQAAHTRIKAIIYPL